MSWSELLLVIWFTRHLLLEWLLPGVHLDELYAVEDLIHRANSAVCYLHGFQSELAHEFSQEQLHEEKNGQLIVLQSQQSKYFWHMLWLNVSGCNDSTILDAAFKFFLWQTSSKTWETDLAMLLCEVTDLYRDKHDVGEDSHQCSETQHMAGVHDAHDKEHRGGEDEAPKHGCLEQSVAVVGQDIYQLDVWKRSRENIKTTQVFKKKKQNKTNNYIYINIYPEKCKMLLSCI